MRTRTAINHYLSVPRNVRQSTRAMRTRTASGWSAAWGAKPVSRITLADLEAYVGRLEARGLAPYTLRREVAALRTWGRWLVAHGLWKTNLADHLPAIKARAIRTRTALQDPEIAQLIEACRRGPEWLYPVALTALRTLLRISAILSLRWSHVDLVRRCLRVPGEVQKTGRPIVIPLAPDLYAWLAGRYQAGDGLVFEAPGRVGVWKAFKKATRAASLDVTLHDLRRTGATWLLEHGVALPVVQRLGGWSRPHVLLEFYAQVHSEALSAATDLLGTMGTTLVP